MLRTFQKTTVVLSPAYSITSFLNCFKLKTSWTRTFKTTASSLVFYFCQVFKKCISILYYVVLFWLFMNNFHYNYSLSSKHHVKTSNSFFTSPISQLLKVLFPWVMEKQLCCCWNKHGCVFTTAYYFYSHGISFW